MVRAVLVMAIAAAAGEGQFEILRSWCAARGYQVVGAAHDMRGALQMIENGEADTIVLNSREELSFRLDIITCDNRVRSADRRRGRPRRLR